MAPVNVAAKPENDNKESTGSEPAGSPRFSIRALWPAVLGLVLLALFLLPALHAAIRGDDTWVSEEAGIIGLSNKGIGEDLWDQSIAFFQSGRPNPLATTQGLFFAWALGDHPMLLHAVIIALTLVAGALLYRLAGRLGLSSAAALLVVVLVAGAIQFRSYHDPMLGYWGTTQIVLILTLASLASLVDALRSGQGRAMVVAFVLFLPCPLLYEGAYPLVALHLGVAFYERRGRSAWRAALPFLALAVLFSALSLLARATSTGIVPGYEVGGSLGGAVRTFIVQLFAPIPGSYLFFNTSYGVFLPTGGSPTSAELLA
ncbi:MAG: hypothetical protein WKH68_11800, partial [Candidatus Limnocylindria bacterium]